MSVCSEIVNLLNNKLCKLWNDRQICIEQGDVGQLEIIDRQIDETQKTLDKLK